MKGINTYEKGIELVMGYNSIQKFVKDNCYSPFDYEALRVIHTAYIACSEEKVCIEGKIRQEAENTKDSKDLFSAEFNLAMRVLTNEQKYFNRMTTIYLDEIQPLI